MKEQPDYIYYLALFLFHSSSCYLYGYENKHIQPCSQSSFICGLLYAGIPVHVFCNGFYFTA